MPIGSYSIVGHVAQALVAARPRRVLDLGIGFGMYGAVVRQWLDFGVRPWSTYLAGVEGWARYGNPLWDLYDLVVVDSIQKVLERPPGTFDFILMNDVIEHFELGEGVAVVERARQLVNPGGNFVIATPATYIHQEAVFGNEFERHRSLWHADNLRALGFELILEGTEPQQGNPMLLGIWRQTG